MADAMLRLVVRTAQAVAAELDARSLRVPADTGQVGFRPRCEPAVMAVEPGLVLVWTPGGLRFVATAGGLLRCDGDRVVLLTPVAVVGSDAQTVRAQLEAVLGAPSAHAELREAIERLETGILRELRKGERPAPLGGFAGGRP